MDVKGAGLARARFQRLCRQSLGQARRRWRSLRPHLSAAGPEVDQATAHCKLIDSSKLADENQVASASRQRSERPSTSKAQRASAALLRWCARPECAVHARWLQALQRRFGSRNAGNDCSAPQAIGDQRREFREVQQTARSLARTRQVVTKTGEHTPGRRGRVGAKRRRSARYVPAHRHTAGASGTMRHDEAR